MTKKALELMTFKYSEAQLIKTRDMVDYMLSEDEIYQELSRTQLVSLKEMYEILSELIEYKN